MSSKLIALLLILISTAFAGHEDEKCGTEVLSDILNSANGTRTKITQTHMWGKFDCKKCSRKGISAEPRAGEKELTKCPHCGAPIDKNVVFYLDNETHPETGEVINPNLVKNREDLKIAKAGENWDCRYCKSSNRALNPACQYCGADREGPAINKIQEPEIKPATNPRNLKPLAIGAASVAGAGALGGGSWWLFSSREVDGKVSEMRWSHSINIETFTRVSRRSQKDRLSPIEPRMPVNGTGERPGVFNIRNCSEEHVDDQRYIDHYETRCEQSTKKIPDGKSCERQCSDVETTVPDGDKKECKKKCSNVNNKNGSFTEKCVETCTPKMKIEKKNKCEEVCTPKFRDDNRKVCKDVPIEKTRPIFKTVCDYDTYAWIVTGSKELHGGAPESEMLPWPKATGELERAIPQANYDVVISYNDNNEKKTHTTNPKSEQEFKSWHIGEKVKLFINQLGVSRVQRGNGAGK